MMIVKFKTVLRYLLYSMGICLFVFSDLPEITAQTAQIEAMAIVNTSQHAELVWRVEGVTSPTLDIYRAVQPGNNYQLIGTAPTADNRYVDAGVQPDTNYCYWIRTVSGTYAANFPCVNIPASTTGNSDYELYTGETITIPLNTTDNSIMLSPSNGFATLMKDNSGRFYVQLRPQVGDQGTYQFDIQSSGTSAADPLLNNTPAENWQLIFEDDFDGTTLDTGNWHTCFPWSIDAAHPDWCNNTGTQEDQIFIPDQVQVNNGRVNLIADRRNVYEDYDYVSGMIASHGKFSFRYGFVESKIRLPWGRGLWSALWMLPNGYQWPPEIDIFELLGHRMEWIHFTRHYEDQNGIPRMNSIGVRDSDFHRNEHVVGLKWTEDELVWYIDGRERFRLTENIPDVAMYLLATLSVGGDWAGQPDANTYFPGAYEIDYIRVWQEEEDAFQPLPANTPLSQSSDNQFTVTVKTPVVEDVVLINADTGTTLRTVRNGDVINIGDLSPVQNFALVARPSSPDIQSVRFWWDGQNIDRTNPFAVFGTSGNNYTPWNYSVGVHTLTTTGFTSPVPGNNPGEQNQIRFMVLSDIDNRDSDNDNVINEYDMCPGFDDRQDIDDDGTPDGCDTIDNRDDDNDGVINQDDMCPGVDDTIDTDNDGIPDNCNDSDTLDDDNDGVVNRNDQCPGGDDTIDTDNDGIPDACDDVDNRDDDNDGVINDNDVCPDADDTSDADNDGIPNDCDDDYEPLIDTTDPTTPPNILIDRHIDRPTPEDSQNTTVNNTAQNSAAGASSILNTIIDGSSINTSDLQVNQIGFDTSQNKTEWVITLFNRGALPLSNLSLSIEFAASSFIEEVDTSGIIINQQTTQVDIVIDTLAAGQQTTVRIIKRKPPRATGTLYSNLCIQGDQFPNKLCLKTPAVSALPATGHANSAWQLLRIVLVAGICFVLAGFVYRQTNIKSVP